MGGAALFPGKVEFMSGSTDLDLQEETPLDPELQELINSTNRLLN